MSVLFTFTLLLADACVDAGAAAAVAWVAGLLLNLLVCFFQFSSWWFVLDLRELSRDRLCFFLLLLWIVGCHFRPKPQQQGMSGKLVKTQRPELDSKSSHCKVVYGRL